MIKQATKGISIWILMLLIMSVFGIAQDNPILTIQKSQPTITQDDLIDFINFTDQGLTTSKEPIEIDRFLNEITSNPIIIDNRSVRLIDISSSNRN